MKRLELVDLAALDAAIGDELRAAALEVVAEGGFILGERVAAFEAALAQHCGVAHAVGVASGSDALVLALRAMGVVAGDAVLTTPLTFVATAEAIHRVGAVARFVDVEPERLTLCPRALQAALETRDPEGRRRRAIVPVHLYGRVGDSHAYERLADDYRVAVVHDAAHALGGRYGDTALGAHHQIACLSFHPSKTLGAWGDGGALLSDNPDFAAHLRRLRIHGRDDDGRNVEVGLNSRLDALQAAVLLAKLRHLPAHDGGRRAVMRRYERELGDLDSVQLLAPLRAGDMPYLFTLRCNRREALREHLDARGIDSRVYYPKLLCDHPAYASHVPLPVARAAVSEVLSLPAHPFMTDADIERVVTAIRSFE